MPIPFERGALGAYSSKAAWDAVALDILGSMLERWHLTDARIFPATAAAVVAAVRCEDGSPAVLKIGYPHEEGVWEAAALDSLPPELGPAVLAQDPWTWAMLLERLEPGTSLAGSGLPVLDAVRVGSELHRRLAAAPHPAGVPPIAVQYRPFVNRLFADHAAAALREAGLAAEAAVRAAEEFDLLCATSPPPVLLHGDLNPTNILLHGSSWRIVDPKPAIGDPAFDTFSLVRDLLADTGTPDEVSQLTEVAAVVAGVDRERALRWIRVRGILSAFWNGEDGLTDAARRDGALARSAEDLLGD